MTKEQKNRLLELNSRDHKLVVEIGKCYDNLAALERLTEKEEKQIRSLVKERETYELEMLNLQSEFDYEKDTKAEKHLKSKQ